MRISDLDAIATIEARTLSTAQSSGYLPAFLKNEALCGFVDDLNTPDFLNILENPMGLAGYILALIIVDEAEILSIAVKTDYQKCGRGARLMEHFIAYATARGVKTVLLEVAADNLPALSLYKRHGFTEFGRRDAYYKRSDGRCDAIMMRRLCN